jgi:amidase
VTTSSFDSYGEIAEAHRGMRLGTTSAVTLTEASLGRIRALDRSGPTLAAIIELDATALEQAQRCDAALRAGQWLGPLHGIPILLKDNIDRADGTVTTAGSFALHESMPQSDATIVTRLREAGAILLGSTNMSEWANFRSTRSVSGWSARGGQCRNPYVLDRSPCGSSSGSAVAVAAGYVMAAIGTETDGSIVCPSSVNGIVGIKPTVGRVSRAGVVPVSSSQDTVGPHARTVADAVRVLAVIQGIDPRDATTHRAPPWHLPQFDPRTALQGARIGVVRQHVTGHHPLVDRLFESALATLRYAGATLVDPVDITTYAELAADDAELVVLQTEFKHELARYLATRVARVPDGFVPRSLSDIIAYNRADAARTLQWFGQEIFEQAQRSGELSDPHYEAARVRARRLGGADGIDAAMVRQRVDALVAPTTGPAWPIDPVHGDRSIGSSCGPAAVAGLPLVTVPAGFAAGLPVGLSFMGRAFDEVRLVWYAAGFEAHHAGRRAPTFRPTIG